jgi:HD superfamily phosphodiesterase
MNLDDAKKYILNRLQHEINKNYSYHNVSHTINVYEACDRIAKEENLSKNKTDLLLTAALFHDSGMLISYIEHEEASTLMTKEILPEFDYSPEEIEEINKMILTTKLPQSAKTLEEKILCDADLDYLGRDDFYMIAHQLKYEWKINGINKLSLREWYELQISFLDNHKYFTQTESNLREKKKLKHLKEIKNLLEEN